MPGLDLVQVVDPLSVVVFARFDESTIDDVRTAIPRSSGSLPIARRPIQPRSLASVARSTRRPVNSPST
jgi:hypothetical protein